MLIQVSHIRQTVIESAELVLWWIWVSWRVGALFGDNFYVLLL